MRVMTIKIAVETTTGRNIYEDTLAAVRALERAIRDASGAEPALGGPLTSESGQRVGSYVVDFPGEGSIPSRIRVLVN